MVILGAGARFSNAFPIAAIVGMFFSNQFADRNFAAEKFLAFSHFVGGLAILGLAFTKEFWPFFALMLVHCLLYVPTISITNSIAFAHLKDPRGIRRGAHGRHDRLDPGRLAVHLHPRGLGQGQRGPTRTGFVDWFGTVLASGLTGPQLQEGTRWTFIVAGVASLVLAAFSFALPHTPPKKAEEGAEALAWLEAVKLLKHPFVLVLWLVTFVDAFVLNSYFNWTGVFLGTSREAGGVGIPGNWIMPIMSVGQIAEILTMSVLAHHAQEASAGV